MNETNKFEQLQPIYPAYVNASYQEDEINLVDVWIELTRYGRHFLVVFSALVVLGLLLAFFVFNEKHTLTSALQIGSYKLNGHVTQIESPRL